MAHPTGESESDTLRLDFDRRLKLVTGAGVWCNGSILVRQ
jgi:hypothetical protein